jgi:hypothetical protein
MYVENYELQEWWMRRDNFSKKIMKTCGLMNRKGNTINIQEGQDKKLYLSTTTILEEMLTS